ncbi:DMT family transporter [Calidifontibacter sp. DB0510]|uniref:DMT family transporter n=1 Tax=Metallococcus carri TaxID=1656884 RepID=A0A967B439_9MICO|nr:DMT family transporter [Metallococcus carri]NHN56920.1 DMT family transporter [Metallococcus carri]NOP37665.1 DMT family transporter [Calidifontibacter sp. DB2511S]
MPVLPVAIALAAALSWGSADYAGGIFARRIAAVRVVVVSQAGALAVMTLVFAARLVRSGMPGGAWLGWGALCGVAGTVALTSFYAALARGTMGVVSPIAATGAILPVVAGWVAGDRLGALTLAGIGCALAGIILASGPELSGAVGRMPVLLALVAAAGFGTSMVSLHQGARSNIVGTLWAMRLTSVVMLAVVLLVRRPSGGRPARRDLPGLWLTGCGDLLANALFSIASGLGAVGVVGVLSSLYPVVTVVLAWVLLHERLRRVQLVGVLLALVGVALTVL